MSKFHEVSDEECLQMGRSVLLIGMKRAIALLQAQSETLEAQLSMPAVNGNIPIRPAMRRTMALIEKAEIVPDTRRSVGSKSYWAKLTPEERSKEMKRRRRVGQRRKAAEG